MRHPIRQKDVVQLWTGDAKALVTANHRVPSWRRGAESVLVIWTLKNLTTSRAAARVASSAGERLSDRQGNRQTNAQERREDAERGRGRLDQVGHGGDADPSARCRRIRPGG